MGNATRRPHRPVTRSISRACFQLPSSRSTCTRAGSVAGGGGSPRGWSTQSSRSGRTTAAGAGRPARPMRWTRVCGTTRSMRWPVLLGRCASSACIRMSTASGSATGSNPAQTHQRGGKRHRGQRGAPFRTTLRGIGRASAIPFRGETLIRSQAIELRRAQRVAINPCIGIAEARKGGNAEGVGFFPCFRSSAFPRWD